MRNGILVCLTLIMVGLGTVVVVSGTSEIAGATSKGGSHKAAFCDGVIKLDKAGANTATTAAFLAALKANETDVTEMANNEPSGSVGADARQLIAAQKSALATGNTKALTGASMSPISGAVDSYCDVRGSGQALPTYFDKGKGSSFCKTFLPVYNGIIGSFPSTTQILAVLMENKAAISKDLTRVSSLPSSIKPKAQQTLSAVESAVKEDSANPLLTSQEASQAQLVALYCGEND